MRNETPIAVMSGASLRRIAEPAVRHELDDDTGDAGSEHGEREHDDEREEESPEAACGERVEVERAGDEDGVEPRSGKDVAVSEVDQLDDAVHHRVSDRHESVDRAEHERVAKLLPHEVEAALLVGGNNRHKDHAQQDRGEVLGHPSVSNPDHGPNAAHELVGLIATWCQAALIHQQGGRNSAAVTQRRQRCLRCPALNGHVAVFPGCEKGRAPGALP